MVPALAAVLGGAFSRLAGDLQISGAGAAGVGILALGFVAGVAANGSIAPGNVLQYTLPLVCFLVCMLIASRVSIRRRDRGARWLRRCRPCRVRA